MNAFNIVSEGVLDTSNKKNVGKNIKNIYPLPPNTFSQQGTMIYIEWKCKKYIQDNFDIIKKWYDYPEEFDGLIISWRLNYVEVRLSSSETSFAPTLKGTYQKSLQTIKTTKMMYNFLERLHANPNLIKELFQQEAYVRKKLDEDESAEPKIRTLDSY